jgi:4-cresol dehydrogenase (hydroxylating)
MESVSGDTFAGEIFPSALGYASQSNMKPSDREARAISAWERILGSAHVETRIRELANKCASTTGILRRVVTILQPHCLEEVIAVVNVANEFQIPVYPISRGRNWGYGEANPPVDGCAIVDLSRMNRIIDVDEKLGIATIEPGVSQGDLYAYLAARRLPFMVPTHGGGPDCSLVGNALERGYGLTKFTDHFGAVTTLQAVLPNGEVYGSPFAALGATDVDRLYKWGIGPNLNGLFSQGNFGIVTRATISLATRPECIRAFFFSLPSDEKLIPVIEATQELIASLGATLGGINFMNALRVLAMVTPYPLELLCDQRTLSETCIDTLCRKEGIGRWIGAGYVSGPQMVVDAATHSVRKRLKNIVHSLSFFDQKSVQRARFFNRILPMPMRTKFHKRITAIQDFLDIVSGMPSRVALPLAYWKSNRPSGAATKDNPASDGCGLIWYSPIIPMRSTAVLNYVRMVTGICRQYGIEPLITLTSLSHLCFDSTIPILFDRNDPQEVERAEECFKELFNRGLAQGVPPYRVGANHMAQLTNMQCTHWKTVGRMKEAIDPNNILAPGRYSPNSCCP